MKDNAINIHYPKHRCKKSQQVSSYFFAKVHKSFRKPQILNINALIMALRIF